MSLDQLSINEKLGDVPTHFMKSGSCMQPKARLDILAKFREETVPEEYNGCSLEYDLWYNTNELHTIRTFLYTDFFALLEYSAEISEMLISKFC